MTPTSNPRLRTAILPVRRRDHHSAPGLGRARLNLDRQPVVRPQHHRQLRPGPTDRVRLDHHHLGEPARV